MKGLLRYKSVSVWMIVIFSVSFVIFYYSIQAKLTGMFEQRDSIENSYKYGCTVLIVPDMELYNENTDYKKYLQESLAGYTKTAINISIIDLTLKNDKYGMNMLADIYISGPKPKYPLVSGEYPYDSQIQSSGKYAVLGRSRMKYTYDRNGKKYIDMSGETYQVTGCMSTGRSHFLDNDIIIYDSDYNGRLWGKMNDYIKMGMVQVVFESDEKSDMDDILLEFQQFLSETSEGTLEASVISNHENTKITTSYMPRLQYRRWAWLAYVFVIVTTIFTFEYWLMRRKKEFAIKKTFGYSTVRIVACVLLEALTAMLAGTVIGAVLVLTNNGLAEGFLVFNKEIFLYFVLIVGGYIVLTLVLIGIYPVVKLLCVTPVGLLYDKRGNQ